MGKRPRAEVAEETSSKKTKAAEIDSINKPQRKTNEEGDSYWEISSKRRITVNEFKGTTYVGIREFYEKDGKSLPGKSGISLSVEQFTSLLLLIPDIKTALHEKGYDISVNNDANGTNAGDSAKDKDTNAENGTGEVKDEGGSEAVKEKNGGEEAESKEDKKRKKKEKKAREKAEKEKAEKEKAEKEKAEERKKNEAAKKKTKAKNVSSSDKSDSDSSSNA